MAMLGPLLALPRRWHLPLMLGELIAGVLLGPTGTGLLHAQNGTFTFLADIGFALIMFVAGTHVPARDERLRAVLRVGALRALGVGVLSVALAFGIAILFTLAALAVRIHVSIMLAGFCFGLAVAAVGEPRRLARQLFALTEGFLGPLFFVWLGASLDLRELGGHPSVIVLGVTLGAGALAVHAAMRLTGQALPIGALAAAQLGVPVAAATVGSELHLLQPGEAAALILGALVTIGVAVLSGALAVRAGLVRPPDQRPSTRL